MGFLYLSSDARICCLMPFPALIKGKTAKPRHLSGPQVQFPQSFEEHITHHADVPIFQLIAHLVLCQCCFMPAKLLY